MRYPAVVTVLFAAQLIASPPPRVIQQIDLSQIVSLPGDYPPGFSFAFSPDEKWLAVTIGAHRDLGSGSVLLLPINRPLDERVEINPGMHPTGTPGWSPESNAFFVQGIVPNAGNPHSLDGVLKAWNLHGEKLFEHERRSMRDVLEGGIFGFPDPAHVLITSRAVNGQPARFETVDLHGGVVAAQTVPKHWRVRDVSPDRHLLAVFPDEQASKTLIVDASSNKVVLTRDNPYDLPASQGGVDEYFTEGGKTLCSVGSVGYLPERKDTLTECWDVDSGRKIAQFDHFLGGAPAAASSHGSRLVLTNALLFTSKHDQNVLASYGDRVAWDFRSGKEISVWNTPQFIWKTTNHGINSPAPMPVAISSTGRFIAEGYGTLLRISELP